jgi:hypothetical protein
MSLISNFAIEQCRDVWELRVYSEECIHQNSVSTLEDEIRELRKENSNLRAALELKEIELVCRLSREKI